MSALNEQAGGSHYKGMAIQPVEYIHKNGIGFIEGNVIKYVSRWRAKGGVQDLKKARHFLDILIEMESQTLTEKKLPIVYTDFSGLLPCPRCKTNGVLPGNYSCRKCIQELASLLEGSKPAEIAYCPHGTLLTVPCSMCNEAKEKQP